MYQFPANIGTNRYDSDVVAILGRLQRLGLPADPIAFYGSSSFRMWSSLAEDINSLNVVNLGFGGGTLLSAMHYMDQLLVPLKPRRTLIYFGENDIASEGQTAETAFRHLQTLTGRISQALPQTRLHILAIKPSPARWIYRDEFERFNRLAKDWGEKRSMAVWLDLNGDLLGENGLPMFRYYQPDLVHLNPAGYAIWAQALKAALKEPCEADV
ncbi:SGNH/GDSL hydrolase family protein (plasmid) [Agrobacterium radiobacter]|jgi:lysophospholipase L1-like esterase|uniref:Esterase, SGNH hydrolase-type, subgroup n=1 Tax=Agrobacterium tumefaciens str. B6 TaxID=1183423 RepID=A0A822V9T6_AGRTU|nr:SGNH/GDSL hydrolase family protein [Agrobacterium tumefaciens]KWT84971.1 lysophospholipase [Agrobacterium tumefaciens str. B6]MQB28732.1 lysophospholipase [Agrobacterium tumefaciens]NTA08262.1 lysophospholipase [Agrobacterium tumefaciens]NTA94857.1 lysophospholipase [Agrobacterium tumefaciens]NTB15865.1 lysophospholipase [Agrobacterium tumefaciens]